jgi:hypothetical protein
MYCFACCIVRFTLLRNRHGLLFFRDIFITPACNVAAKIAIVIPLAVGTVPLAGVVCLFENDHYSNDYGD